MAKRDWSTQSSGTKFPWNYVKDAIDAGMGPQSLPQISQFLPTTGSPFFPSGPSGQAGGPYKYNPQAESKTPYKFGVSDLFAGTSFDRDKRTDWQRLVEKGGLGDKFTIKELKDTVFADKGLSNRSRTVWMEAISSLEAKEDTMRQMHARQGVRPDGSMIDFGGKNPWISGPGGGGRAKERQKIGDDGEPMVDESGEPIMETYYEQEGGGGGSGFRVNEAGEAFRWDDAKGQFVRPVTDAEGNPQFDEQGNPRTQTYGAADAVSQGFATTGLGQAARVQADSGRAVGLAGSNVQAQGGVAQATGVEATPIEAMQQVEGAQSDIAKGDFTKFQQDTFKALYNPVRREMEMEHTVERDRMRSLLAGSGMLGSVPHELKDLDDRQLNRMLSTMEQASAEASRQTLGHRFTEEMANADREQQARLANQQWTNTRRIEEAKNLLTASAETARLETQASIATAGYATEASIANAREATQRAKAQSDAYLQAVGINAQQEQAARKDFLGLMGVIETDLARMDAHSANMASLMYDVYLRDKSLILSAGQYSVGLSRSGGVGIGESLATAAVGGLAGGIGGAATGSMMS